MKLFVFLVALITLCSVSGTSRNRPGQDQIVVKTLLAELIGGNVTSEQVLKYNPSFRPPSTQPILPDPTLVQISLGSLEIIGKKQLNQTIGIKAQLFREYKDSRMIYQSLEGVKTLSLKGMSAKVWTPLLVVGTRYGFTEDYRSFPSETLVSPEGRVLIKSSITLGLNDLENVKEFKTKLIGSENTVEEVELMWKRSNPVSLMAEKLIDIEGNQYLIQPTTGLCKHLEDYGAFGIRQFSCLELTLKMVRN